MKSTASVFKSMAKSSSIYAIAVLAGQMSSFLLLPVYTRCLTTNDYGVLELLNLTAFIFSALIAVRFGDALFYHHAASQSDDERQRVIATAFVGAAGIGVAGALIGYLLSPAFSWVNFQNSDYAPQFHLVFVAFAFGPALDLGISYLRALNRTKTFVAVSLSRLGLSIASNLILLLVFRLGINGILWSAVISNGVMCICMTIYVFREVKPAFSWPVLRDQLKYAFPLGVGGLGMLIIHFGDRYFLKQYISLSDLGIYSLAYKMGMLISYIQMPFDIYWRAQMFTLVAGPNGSKIYIRVCTYLTLGMAFVTVLIGVWIRPVLRVMAAPEFAPAADYVPWIAGAYAIRTVGTYFRSIFLLRRRTGMEAVVTWISSAVCLAGYAFLIPRYYAWGAVAATFLAFLVMMVVGFWQAQLVEAFQFEYRRILEIAVLTATILIAESLLHPTAMLPQVIAAVCFTVAFPAVLLAIRFFDAQERAGFAEIWARLRSYRLLGRSDSVT